MKNFSTLKNFLKNDLEYQNGSKFVRGPNSTYATIWDKNITWDRKSREFLIFRSYIMNNKSEFYTLTVLTLEQKFSS